MHTLKILFLEDLAADAELIKKYLERNGLKFEATIAASQIELMLVLEEIEFDIVLADHSLSSIEALKMARAKDRNIPFILVGGETSEEESIKIMQKEAADDYVLIDNLKRLPTAIRQAIKHRLTELGKELCESKLLGKNITATPIDKN